MVAVKLSNSCSLPPRGIEGLVLVAAVIVIVVGVVMVRGYPMKGSHCYHCLWGGTLWVGDFALIKCVFLVGFWLCGFLE